LTVKNANNVIFDSSQQHWPSIGQTIGSHSNRGGPSRTREGWAPLPPSL